MMATQKNFNSKHSAAFLKERRYLLFLPVVIIPFLTIAFLALGGGKNRGESHPASGRQGLNSSLPQARFKDAKTGDKMSVYQEAVKDSSGAQSGIGQGFIKAMGFRNTAGKRDAVITYPSPSFGEPSEADANEAKIKVRLDQINRQLAQRSDGQASYPEPAEQRFSNANIKRLHKMMASANESGTDPEMQQLSAMLAQIQSIQNPGSAVPKPSKMSPAKPFHAIPAVIDGKQKVVDGAAVRLKLTENIVLKGQPLKKGQQLFGSCQIANQRLLLTISNIRTGNNIIPVNLTVFSQDGMPGIPAPEAELAGSAADGADNAIQNMQLVTMDQSMAAQAAAGGVNAAKTLFGKKMKKIKVKLKDGYPVLLRINI